MPCLLYYNIIIAKSSVNKNWNKITQKLWCLSFSCYARNEWLTSRHSRRPRGLSRPPPDLLPHLARRVLQDLAARMWLGRPSPKLEYRVRQPYSAPSLKAAHGEAATYINPLRLFHSQRHSPNKRYLDLDQLHISTLQSHQQSQTD